MLTRNALAYYDSADPFKRKERGRILLKDVRLVERVVLREQRDRDEPNRPHAFQIGYREMRGPGNSSSAISPRPPQEYFLCILAKSDMERDDWIGLFRNLIRANAHLAEKYHPSLWSAGRWPCCGDTSKASSSGTLSSSVIMLWALRAVDQGLQLKRAYSKKLRDCLEFKTKNRD